MSLFKSGFWFAIGTLLSRIFGLLRESVVAGVFGASISMDAFLVANRIPNMLRELTAEGALGSSFTKVFSEQWEKDPDRARRLLFDSLLFFGLLSVLICLTGIYTSPWLVEGMTLLGKENAVGENKVFLDQAKGLTRLLFPFIGMMMIASISGGALHQKGRFLLSSLSPIALNLGYLLGALVFARLLTDSGPDWVETVIADKAITGLALGVLLGGMMQLGMQLAGLWKPFIKPFQCPGFSSFSGFSPEVKKVLWLMGPMVIASGAGQINVLINTNFATSLGAGAVTWLSFAFRLLQLPIGIFAVAVSAVALPAFSRLLSDKTPENKRKLSDQLFHACELMIWLMSACFVVIALSGDDMIRLLFEQGAFTRSDSLATGQALFYYSFGLMGYGLVKVLSSYYYACDRTSWAMKISLISIGLNFVLNYFLVDRFGVNGLAMTASCILSLNALGLLLGLRKDQLWPSKHQWLKGGGFLIVALVCAMAVGMILEQYLFPFIQQASWHYKIKSALGLSINGTVVILIFLILGCVRSGLSPLKAVSRLKRARQP